MWPVRRLWKKVRLTATFLIFLLVIFLFSYGVVYLFDKQLVGGLLRHQNSRRRDSPLAMPAALKQDLLLAADIFPAAVGEDGPPTMKSSPVSGEREQLNYNVHIFYYGWYGNPEIEGQWWHWNHEYLPNWDKSDHQKYPTGAHKPPEDIGANFYPSLGAYSSSSEPVIRQHMAWIRKAGVGVVVVSWYPPGLADEHGPQSDSLVPILLRLAAEYHLRISLHIEPYENRTVENLREHLSYVNRVYGSHPAYYKMRRGGQSYELPVFYVYDSYRTEPQQWARLFSSKGDLTVRNTELDGIFLALLVEFKHRHDIKKAKFDGFYTYFAANGFSYGSSWKNWRSLAAYGYQNSLMFVASVGPGYLDTRVRPWNGKNRRDRRGGVYYETAWQTALSAPSKIVSITSFNEWHEGTQIEPAVPYSCDTYTYQSYYPKDPDYYLKLTRNFSSLMTGRERSQEESRRPLVKFSP